MFPSKNFLIEVCRKSKFHGWSIEDANSETFDQFKAELVDEGFLNPTDEDVLSYALFPQVAEEFFKKHYQAVTAYKR